MRFIKCKNLKCLYDTYNPPLVCIESWQRPSPVSLPLSRTLAPSALSCKWAPELASVQTRVDLKGKTALPLAPLSIGTPYPFAGRCKNLGEGGELGQCLIYFETKFSLDSSIQKNKHACDVRWLFNVSKNSLWNRDLFYKSIHILNSYGSLM